MPARAHRTVEEHLAEILAAVSRLESVRLALQDAAGSTLAAPALAQTDTPVFDNSAMDGFAVRAGDAASASPSAPSRLRVVADLPAGSPLDPPLAPGEAARIMTGAPVPSAADAVVPLEHTVDGLESGAEVAIVQAPVVGAHIRRAGEDVQAGTEILGAGALLGALQLGALAAAGVTEVVVSRRPRVAVVSTGSELAAAGLPLLRGQIPESNGALLARLAEEAGAVVVHRGTAADDIAALEGELAAAEAAQADLVITSGGVGPGAYEVVRHALHARLRFVTVAMRPGKPQGFGQLENGMLAFGLPGTPVGAAISFEIFVRPALLALQGRMLLHRPALRLPAAERWRTRPGVQQFLPATVDRSDPARWTVRSAAGHGHSSIVLAFADAYAVIPAETEGPVREGDLVDTILLGGEM